MTRRSITPLVAGQQRDLPDVAGERVGPRVLGPRLVQVPAQVAEQPAGSRVVLHPARLADKPRIGLAQRGGSVETGQQDPDLGGVQRRGCLIAALQGEQHLGLQQIRQAGQGELVHSQAGPLGGDPRCELLAGQRRDGMRALQPLVVETAQPAAGGTFTVTAGDPAVAGPLQRPGPGDERRDGFGAVLAPAALVPETQSRAVQVTFATGHRATVREQRPSHAGRRRGIELLPAGPGRHPGPPASVAPSRRAARRRRAPRCPARPRPGSRRRQIPGEQQHSAVPFTGTPVRAELGTQPWQPSGCPQPILRYRGGNRCQQRGAAHRYRFPAATASTA
jgi:hypothetical protein